MDPNQLKIDAYFLCFNERKMVKHTLNYYSRFCENITIIDNQSTDDTRSIIEGNFKDVTIKEMDSGGENREDLKIGTKNNCWKNADADFVIVADMDEFIYHPQLLHQLQLVKTKGVAIPVVYGYQMLSETYPDDYSKLLTEQLTYGFRDWAFDKSVIFDPKLVKEINYGPGAHYCQPIFYSEENRKEELVELRLLHFKYIDRQYLYNRHQLIASRISNFNKRNGFSTHYQKGDQYIDRIYNLKSNYLKRVVD